MHTESHPIISLTLRGMIVERIFLARVLEAVRKSSEPEIAEIFLHHITNT